ncbi:MAG TPA: putative toxin-antitoxin system toxin component, PIN family [Verrucomicrobiae bacterium]|jgi:putative PIN family toxin of toxin-antitoxin system
MKLAVIDPVVFAAGVFWRHEPHLCLKAWLHGLLTPVVSEDILAEYEAVLEQVKQEHHFTTDTEIWLDALRESAMWVEWDPVAKRICRDFRDERLIEAALTAGCHTLIARDRNLTALDKPLDINLYTPREWLGRLTGPQRKRLHG